MKKKLISIVAFFFFFSIFINYAYSDTTHYAKSKKITNYLKRNLCCPDKYLDDQKRGLVIIDFMITTEGSLKINKINYSNYELKEIVVKKLEKMAEQKGQQYKGQKFLYKIQFKGEII